MLIDKLSLPCTVAGIEGVEVIDSIGDGFLGPVVLGVRKLGWRRSREIDELNEIFH